MKRRQGLGLSLIVLPPRAEASLWRRLRYEREARCREEIFGRYRNLARAVAARQMRLRRHGGAELHDVEHFAYEGLLQAIDRFDPLRGAPFGAFAKRRILGSIADGTVRMSELSAQYGQKRRAERERARSIIDDLAPEENALRALATLASGLAIGLMLAETNMIVADNEVDHRPNAYDTLARRELAAALVREIARLPEREGMILRQHYEHGLSFTHIANLLGLSKGRISQLHAAALGKLRRRLNFIR